MAGGSRREGGGLPRRLTKRFVTLAEFQEEYRRNLANGGIFIETDEVFALREEIEVELDLWFGSESVQLRGEVVSQVAPVVRRAGGTPGVAIQLVEPAKMLRRRLGGLARLPLPSTFEPTESRPSDTRDGVRTDARVAAQLETAEGALEGRTRNVSRSGVLMSVDGPLLPVGSRVRLSLVHPTQGTALDVDGTVVRHAGEGGGAPAVAIRFECGDDPDTAARFIASLQSAEHARRLGAVGGSIQALGLPNLVQMFSSCAERGTLRVASFGQQGVIAFEGGALAYAALGPHRGLKALARIFTWKRGTFEFDNRLEPCADAGEPAAIYGVVMEALTRVDELGRLDLSQLPAGGRLRLDVEKVAALGPDLEETQSAVLDLVQAGGATVRSVVDGLPGCDAEIYAALLALRETGALEIERP